MSYSYEKLKLVRFAFCKVMLLESTSSIVLSDDVITVTFVIIQGKNSLYIGYNC